MKVDAFRNEGLILGALRKLCDIEAAYGRYVPGHSGAMLYNRHMMRRYYWALNDQVRLRQDARPVTRRPKRNALRPNPRGVNS